jgi:hypothetical protein
MPAAVRQMLRTMRIVISLGLAESGSVRIWK